MRMPELKALAREHRLRGYSRLRKTELIELIRNNQQPLQSWEPNRPPQPTRPPPPPPTQTWDPRGSWALQAHGNHRLSHNPN